MLSREQRVHAETGLCRKLLEAAPLDFVRLEHEPLLGRQFFDGSLQFINQYLTRIGRFRPPSCAGRTTLKSQAPTCSIGCSIRVDSTSSENTSWRMSSASATSSTRRRMNRWSRPDSRSMTSAMRRSCSRTVA
jgi:hypothetical protein